MNRKIIIVVLMLLLSLSIKTTYAYWASEVTSNAAVNTSDVCVGTWTIITAHYNFEESSILQDLIDDGSSVVVGSFTNTGSSLQSSYGVIYIPNPLESYTISVRAQLLSATVNGGFGVLFDTYATDSTSQSDNGWIFQYDQGYSAGELIIRPRINGAEQAPVLRYSVYFDANGELSTTGTKDSTNVWWENEHTVKLDVSVLNAETGQKRVMVYIDDEYLFSYDFISTLFDSTSLDNITGFRTWRENTAFYEITIETE
ncbi:MAG: hypothetical protein WCR19_00480 [Acholeplasmataceae bacterium]